jgi:hypothetical protein
MRNLCTFSFLTVLFLAACGQAPTASTTTPTTATTTPPAAPTPTPAPAPTVATFSEFPPEIEGCSCTFSEGPKEDYSTHLYADNFDNMAFLNIDGKMEKFTLAETMKTPENRMDRIFRNEKYELRVDLEKSGQVDSATKYKGSFTLTPKGGTAIVKNIVGSCGC